MRFICTGVCGVIAYIVYPSGVFDIPFSQLTLGNIVSLIGSVLFGLGAIANLFGEWD